MKRQYLYRGESRYLTVLNHVEGSIYRLVPAPLPIGISGSSLENISSVHVDRSLIFRRDTVYKDFRIRRIFMKNNSIYLDLEEL